MPQVAQAQGGAFSQGATFRIALYDSDATGYNSLALPLACQSSRGFLFS
jgi:hypothetical protein